MEGMKKLTPVLTPVWIRNQPTDIGKDITYMYLEDAGIEFELREDGVPLVKDFKAAKKAVRKPWPNEVDFERKLGLPALMKRI